MAISIHRIIFLKKLWPDFNSTDLIKVIKKFKKIKKELWKNMISDNTIKEYTSIILFSFFL